MRILVLLAIALLLYVIITNLIRKAKMQSPAEKSSERMVKCEQCGLHVLEQEALKDNQYFFCSTEHLEHYRQSK